MIKPKKSLGQNFLKDQNIINKIIDTTEIKDKVILEVGPGTGNLTEQILKRKPKNIFVIEKDNNLVILLKKKFENKINIINADILNFDENSLSDEPLLVFGNLPYNISTEILIKWILNLNYKKIWFSQLVLMFQKEVADRITSNFNSSNYGRLSIMANWKLNIKKIIDIKPVSFFPKPKVESSLLLFSPKKNFQEIQNPSNLEKITRSFFKHRRKMIKKPYNQLFKNNLEVQKKLKLNLSLRPQNLDFDTYFKLASEYEKIKK